MIRKSASAVLVAALGAGTLVTVAVAPTQAKTIKVCVKKSTGEMRMLTKKKCTKGWKKQTWNTKGATGPKGDTGPQGPNLMVKDGSGATVGRFLGTYPSSVNILTVEVDGGAYTFLANGLLYGIGSPYFKTNTCTGPAYITSDSALATAVYTGMAGGPSRVAYRVTDPGFGPSRAWKFTTTSEVVNQNVYQLDDTGTCVFDSLHNGTLVALQEVAAPADAVPPLTIQ